MFFEKEKNVFKVWFCNFKAYVSSQCSRSFKGDFLYSIPMCDLKKLPLDLIIEAFIENDTLHIITTKTHKLKLKYINTKSKTFQKDFEELSTIYSKLKEFQDYKNEAVKLFDINFAQLNNPLLLDIFDEVEYCTLYPKDNHILFEQTPRERGYFAFEFDYTPYCNNPTSIRFEQNMAKILIRSGKNIFWESERLIFFENDCFNGFFPKF